MTFALVGAFSVIVKTDGSFAALANTDQALGGEWRHATWQHGNTMGA